MIRFGLWLLLREDTAVSDYNGLFHAELQRLLPKLTDPERRRDAIAMQAFDFSRYILRSLRNALLRQGLGGNDAPRRFEASRVSRQV